jgi:excisionase family DNA binding protein
MMRKSKPRIGKLIFTVTEVAQLLGLSARTLVRWEKEGRIPPARRDRRDRRIYTAAEVRMLAQHVYGVDLAELQ